MQTSDWSIWFRLQFKFYLDPSQFPLSIKPEGSHRYQSITDVGVEKMKVSLKIFLMYQSTTNCERRCLLCWWHKMHSYVSTLIYVATLSLDSDSVIGLDMRMISDFLQVRSRMEAVNFRSARSFRRAKSELDELSYSLNRKLALIQQTW